MDRQWLATMGPGCVKTDEIDVEGPAPRLRRGLHGLCGDESSVLMKKALRPWPVSPLTLLL
jgi:hypothetical protein